MGCAIEVVKLVLFIFNLIFALCGLGLLSLGVIVKLQVDDYESVIKETNLTVAPTFLIVVGAAIFIVAFFGCCGAIRENHCMVVTYAVILLSLLIIEIVIGVYVYMGTSGIKNAETLIDTAVNKLFSNYKSDVQARETIDVIQNGLHCCGVDGPSEYIRVHAMIQLPKSCCKDPGQESCTYIPTNIGANYWTDGCLEKLNTWASNAGTVLTYILYGILGVEIVGVVFALCVASSIKHSNAMY